MIETLFLTEPAIARLTLLQQLADSPNETISINSLASETQSSYPKTQRLVAELAVDLEQLYCQKLFTHTGKLRTGFSTLMIDDYRNFLIKESIPYRFLFTLLTKKNAELSTFCHENFISTASVNRRLAPLKQCLAQYQIQLNVSKMRLYGSESAIRILLFNFFWLVDSGNELLTEEVLPPDIESLSFWQAAWMKNVSQRTVIIHLTIFRLRQQQGCLVENDYHSLLLPESQATIRQIFKVPAENLESEIRFLFYLLIYWPMYYELTDPRLQYLEQSYYVSDNAIFTEAFLDRWYQHLDFTDHHADSLPLLQLNLLIVFANYSIRQTSPPMLLDYFYEQVITLPPNCDMLAKDVRRTLRLLGRRQQMSWLPDCLDELTRNFTLLLLPYVKTQPKEQLHVGIQLDANHFMLKQIVDFCDKLPYVEPIFFSDTLPEQVDFAILSPSSQTPIIEVTHDIEVYRLSNYRISYQELSERLNARLRHKFA